MCFLELISTDRDGLVQFLYRLIRHVQRHQCTAQVEMTYTRSRIDSDDLAQDVLRVGIALASKEADTQIAKRLDSISIDADSGSQRLFSICKIPYGQILSPEFIEGADKFRTVFNG